MKTLLIITSFFIGSACFSQESPLQGKITSDGIAVPFASIYFEDTHFGTTSNENGEFVLKEVPQEKSWLVISAMGFKTLRRKFTGTENWPLRIHFSLETSQEQLSEIVIIDEQTGLTRRTPYNISSISLEGIENKGNPNGMMGILRKVPGVYGAEFGQGIVKPFIRGLGFSRIVTIYQGNKLENHQWGADHGLGINDLGIKRVDVIKGPASVLYGSGALGGVLLARDDEHYLGTKEISGNVGTAFNSTSNGIRTYGSLGKIYKSKLFLATDLAYENHADYNNGESRSIGNSRFNTQTLRVHTGLEKKKFQNKLSFTYNYQNLGIILDQEMDDSQSLATSRNDRKMQLPFQEVEDYLVSYNQHTDNDKFETSLHLSNHLNKRREIESDEDLIDMGLIQNHTFYNARLSFHTGKYKHSLGIQGSLLRNRNMENAEDFLIPDATVLENGVYYLGSLHINSYYVQGAIRYDFRKVTADASPEYLVKDDFILPGAPENRKLTRDFGGFTGSLGLTKKIAENSNLKLNLSTGFRAPDLAELFSNGPHPGTSRFEKGNDSFGREQSLQADISYSYRKDRFQGNVSTFGSLIENYIFFAATNKSMPEEDLEIWEYQQANARFYGFEFEFKHTWFQENRLETTISGAVVRAEDRDTQRALSFIPPDNYNLEFGYYALPDASLHLFSNLRLIDEQDHPGLNEETTMGYVLLNLGASKEFEWGKNSLNTGITLYNALNKTYVDHMSILRTFNVSSPGRNLMLNLRYNF